MYSSRATEMAPMMQACSLLMVNTLAQLPRSWKHELPPASCALSLTRIQKRNAV